MFNFLNTEEIPWIKLLWERYYQTSIPLDKLEGSFWWKAHLALLNEFKNPSSCTLMFGQATLFWKDKWQGEPFQHKFPELHSYAIDDTLSLQRFYASEDWTEHLHMPLSSQAFSQFNQLEELITKLSNNRKDKWVCNGQANKYSSMQMYKHLMGDVEGHRIFKLIWSSSSRLQHKIFVWLVAHCRINTRALLKRKGMHLGNPFCPN